MDARKVCAILAVLLCALFAPPAHAANAASAQAKACAYAVLKPGFVKLFLAPDSLSIDAANAHILFQNRDETFATLVSLDAPAETRLDKRSGEFLAFAGEDQAALKVAGVFLRPTRDDAAAAAASGARPAVRTLSFDDLVKGVEFSDGRGRAAITRLYSGNFILKIYPPEMADYQTFRQDVLAGRYCGQEIARMGKARRAHIANHVLFAMWDDLSSGKIGDFATFSLRADLMRLTVAKERLSQIVDAYCFRVTEALRADPFFAKVDPAKTWNFVWAPVAKLLRDKDWVSFSDISAVQRDGVLTFSLLATERFEQANLNRYGFYQRRLQETPIAGLVAKAEFNWKWSQGRAHFDARYVVSRVEQGEGPRLDGAFPGGREGLVIIDGTLTKEETARTLAQYIKYFENDGFRFGPKRRHADLKGHVRDLIRRAARPDYIIRDGHADGDDENLLVLRRTGLSIVGERPAKVGTEQVSIVFNGRAPKAFMRRVSYTELADWLSAGRGRPTRPVIYFNTSCWGTEKAAVSRGFIAPAQMLEIATPDPSNSFSADRGNVSRLVIDAIRNGSAFRDLRAELARLPEYSHGYADNYVLPDESAFRAERGVLRIKRRLTRTIDGIVKRYVPDGYL